MMCYWLWSGCSTLFGCTCFASLLKYSIQMWQKRILAVEDRQKIIQTSSREFGVDLGSILFSCIMIVIRTRVEVMFTAAAA